MKETKAESRSGITVESLLDYFMTLYKLTLGVPRDASSQIIAVEPSRQYPKLITYDLIVEYNDDKASRRVTVGPIAEETGSQSACFFAIYDSKLVIKIPPRPITDFKEYINCIVRDRKIVATLAPRVCLIPGVSMVLDKIYKFPRTNELKGNQREDVYFEWLNYNQEYQRYLKIEGGFAFFMDLSKHMFLADVLQLFHGLGTKVQEEITRDYSILDNFEKFEGRYGIENTQVGVDLKQVYKIYDEKASRLMTDASATSSDMLYKMQEWFFNYISGKTLDEGNKELSEDRVPGLNQLLGRIVEENREVVDKYRAMVVDYLKSKRYFQNRKYKEGVVANTIEMLAWLKEKGVAVRDIKPDNLLLAGDMDNYPAFLATPERFSIGLIDFETSVVFRSENQQEVEQPFLGGTSLYATPLHMFNNKLLLAFYRELPRAFYLQDWYSVVAMIYRLLTGDSLFTKTSQLFHASAVKLKEAKRANRPAEEVVPEINAIFWKSAVLEFDAKMERKREALQFLRTTLLGSARAMLLEELVAENRRTGLEIRHLIDRQGLFKSKEHREQLLAVTPDQLGQLINKAQENAEAASSSLAQSLAQLKRIQKLKIRVLKNRELMNRLKTEEEDFSVHELMTFMFNRVVYFMDVRQLPAQAG
jgi:serine/threonine protein kinase